MERSRAATGPKAALLQVKPEAGVEAPWERVSADLPRQAGERPSTWAGLTDNPAAPSAGLELGATPLLGEFRV